MTPSAPHRRRGAPAGFTLMEVILALTILALLSGTVFAIISTAVRTTARMRVVQNENDQVSHFIRLCRQAFQNLPATATVTLKIVETGVPHLQELTIGGAPESFGFGPNPISYKDATLGLRPDAAATEAAEDKLPVFNLSLTREDIIPADPGQATPMVRAEADGLLAPDDQGRVWMPLLPNVASLTWRAYKNDEEQWLDEWESSSFPLLVEMNLQLSGRSQPIRAVFTLPVMKLAGANPSLVPRSTSSSSSSQNTSNASASNPNLRGGDRRGGEDRRGTDSRGSDRRGDRDAGRGREAPPRDGAPGSGQPRSGAPPAVQGFRPQGGAANPPGGGGAR